MTTYERISYLADALSDVANALAVAKDAEPNGTIGTQVLQAYSDYLADATGELLAILPGNYQVVPVETLFETPEQELYLYSKKLAALPAITDTLTKCISMSENRAIQIELHVAKQRSDVASATISILESPLNASPYEFSIHWFVEFVATLSQGYVLWHVIQTVDDDSSEDEDHMDIDI